jgi:hypothetical protein
LCVMHVIVPDSAVFRGAGGRASEDRDTSASLRELMGEQCGCISSWIDACMHGYPLATPGHINYL